MTFSFPETAHSPARRARLRAEFALFYLAAPLAVAVFLPPRWMFPVLGAVTLAGLALLAATPGFRWRELLTGAGRMNWALILGVTRRLGEGERILRAGTWEGFALKFLLGTDLVGKQIGIIGMGRIGQSVAAKALAFGMRVAYLPSPRRPDEQLSGPDGTPYAAMDLDTLLQTSDVVTLHVPLTDETRHLLNSRTLAQMKPTAYLVNMARGPVVEEAALVEALDKRAIAGAALDVYELEPAVHPGLLAFENALLAPHLGSATLETRTAMCDLAARNVIEVIEGRAPLTPVAGSYRA